MSDNNNPQVQSHYQVGGGVNHGSSTAAGTSQAHNGYQLSPQQHNETASDYYNRQQAYNANKK